MAMAGGNDGLYQEQVQANRSFFETNRWPPGYFQELAVDQRPEEIKHLKGKAYDITGFSAYCVVALLSDIVNNEQEWKWGQNFYLVINQIVFKLKCMRATHQPGNGVIALKKAGESHFSTAKYKTDVHSEEGKEEGKEEEEEEEEEKGLIEELEDAYKDDTKKFAEEMRRLFQNNDSMHEFNVPIVQAYMLLLFEIARRLVREKETKKGIALDELPIGCAIAKALLLLRTGDCTFKQLFECFTKKRPGQRQQAIKRLNEYPFDQPEYCYLEYIFRGPATFTEVLAKAAEAAEAAEMEAKEERRKAEAARWGWGSDTEEARKKAQQAADRASLVSQYLEKKATREETIAACLRNDANLAKKHSRRAGEAKEERTKAAAATCGLGSDTEKARKKAEHAAERESHVSQYLEEKATRAETIAAYLRNHANLAKKHSRRAGAAAGRAADEEPELAQKLEVLHF